MEAKAPPEAVKHLSVGHSFSFSFFVFHFYFNLFPLPILGQAPRGLL